MTAHAHADHGHHHGSDHGGSHGGSHGGHHEGGESHGSFRGYMTGFVLSVILTAIPFWLVMDGVLDNTTATVVILAFAAVQIVVHMVFFLHMNSRSEGGWTMLALLFTLILLVITLSGSLWVMYHLDYNMMPMLNPADASKLP